MRTASSSMQGPHLTYRSPYELNGGIDWAVTGQLATLANELPQYTSNLKHKIADLRGAGQGGIVEKLQRIVEELLDELHKTDSRRQDSSLAMDSEKPVLAAVQAPSSGSCRLCSSRWRLPVWCWSW
jgi:hypothetical protein